ncbi:MAG: BA14K family protein [Pseudomonadota bacterium]
MTNLKILSVAAAVAVALPAFAATPSFAQNTKVVGVGPGGQARTIGTFSGGGARFGGGGGGWHGGGQRFGGGGGWNHGGGWRGGGWRGSGFGPGFAAGAIIGSGLAASSYYGNSYGYYGGSPYYGSSYYDDAPDVVEVAPDTGGGDVDYCIRTYKSYNVRTGTYLGYDGLRHACP